MWIGRAFRCIWRWALLLPIRLAKLVAWTAIIAAALALGFVLSAQLTRLYSSGDWRPVPFAELLQILHVELPAASSERLGRGIDFLLGLPATLVSFICMIIFYSIKSVLDVPDRWLQRRRRAAEVKAHASTDQTEADEDLIKDIERALDHAGKRQES
jgi:hypothetical protein